MPRNTNPPQPAAITWNAVMCSLAARSMDEPRGKRDEARPYLARADECRVRAEVRRRGEERAVAGPLTAAQQRKHAYQRMLLPWSAPLSSLGRGGGLRLPKISSVRGTGMRRDPSVLA